MRSLDVRPPICNHCQGVGEQLDDYGGVQLMRGGALVSTKDLKTLCVSKVHNHQRETGNGYCEGVSTRTTPAFGSNSYSSASGLNKSGINDAHGGDALSDESRWKHNIKNLAKLAFDKRGWHAVFLFYFIVFYFWLWLTRTCFVIFFGKPLLNYINQS